MAYGSKPQSRRSSGGGSQRFSGGRRQFTNRRKGPKKQDIHPSKFTNKAVEKKDEIPYEATHTFRDFPFGSELHANIEAKGYVSPSPIQDQSIPHILDGRDVLGLANTGTGKTAAFLLPIIERVSGINTRPCVLIVAPTRELAHQINEEFKAFSRGLGMTSALIVGGMRIDRQIQDLKKRPHFVIGTPGRLKDVISRRILKLDNMSVLVLDEADRMLDMGFLPDIKDIVGAMPRDRQTLFFSATITDQIKVLIKDFLQNPETVSVRTSETSDHVEQDVINARDKMHKIDLLKELLEKDGYEKVLVFGETKFGVQRLSDSLTNMGIPSIAIHGNKTQAQRQKALKQFKTNQVRVLVATDVAARGLDIPNVTHVINFDTPQTYDDYVHRIGRTGRGGARGQAHTFIEGRY